MERDMFRFYKAALSGEITTPLCESYKSAWRQCGDDKEMLVRLVMREQSLPYFFAHCYQNKGLSKKYILDEFGEYINGKYTAIDVDGVQGGYKTEIFVGFNRILSLSDDVSCFMWCDIPQLEIKPTKAIKIYAGCSSNINIVCGGYNNVVIMLFDDSTITLDDIDEDSTIIVYKYGDECRVTQEKYCLGTVKEFRKTLRL